MLVAGRLADSPPFDAGDVALLQELVTHAAVAIDNARLFELEHDIARTLQRSLLPARLPDTAPLEVATRYRAAGERIEVGGDVYDVFVAGGSPYAMVADVCGKGPEAAALTATARHALQVAGRRRRARRDARARRPGAARGGPRRPLLHDGRRAVRDPRGRRVRGRDDLGRRPPAAGRGAP